MRNEVYPDVGDGELTKTSPLRKDQYNPKIRDEVYPGGGDIHGVTKTSGLSEERYSPQMRNEVSPDVGDGAVTKTAPLKEDQYNPIIRDEVYPGVGVTRTSGPGKIGTDLGGLTAEAPQPELKTPLPAGTDAINLKEASVVEPMVRIGPLVDLVEDPHSPKNLHGKIPLSNYQTKVVDPTGEGGREAEVAPLVRRLDNLHVHDQSESSPGSEQRSYTGSHDQFAPQSAPTSDQFSPEAPVEASKDEELPKSFDPAKPESMPRDTVVGKISSATSVIADKAVSAKNVVASELGYGGQHQEGQVSSKKAALESVIEYRYKVAEKLAPVYEKVAGAGSVIMSKVQSGGGAQHERGDAVAKNTDKGVSVKEYIAEKFSPGEEDKALSEVITDAIHKKKGVIWRTGEEQPMGQEKKSENMAVAHLVTGKESERDALAAGGENSRTGVVDRVKGAVGSWLGLSSGTQTGQHSPHQEHGSAPSGGGRLSEEEVSSDRPRLHGSDS